jgi:hypothetical protein
MGKKAVAVALLATAAAASAGPAGAQAEVLFREGRKLMAAGKTAEACAAFEESQKLDPATTTLLNLAACREQNGQLATAWGLFLDAERQTRTANDDATQKLHDVARTHAEKLEPRVSKLTIAVKHKRDGLEIKRDQERVDPVMWNRALPIDGGKYTIHAHSDDGPDFTTKVTVAVEGDSKVVEIPDPAAEPADDREPSPPPDHTAPAHEPPHVAATHDERDEQEPDHPASSTGGSRVVPIALGVGSLALLGGAFAFSRWGDSTYDQAKAEMTDQARRDSLYSSANTKRYVAEGLAVGGVACAGLAVWAYLHARRGDSGATALVVSPSGIALAGSFW